MVNDRYRLLHDFEFLMNEFDFFLLLFYLKVDFIHKTIFFAFTDFRCQHQQMEVDR